MENNRTFDLVLTGLFTALVMVTTMIIRIPMPLTNGYVHLGDTTIYLAVLILGKKRGSIAAGTGSALADLFSGYAHYVPWTFVIKALMALVMGLALDGLKKRGKHKQSSRLHLYELPAMTLAGLEMTAGYFLAAGIMYGNWLTALTSVPGNIAQFTVGMLIAWTLAGALEATPISASIRGRSLD